MVGVHALAVSTQYFVDAIPLPAGPSGLSTAVRVTTTSLIYQLLAPSGALSLDKVVTGLISSLTVILQPQIGFGWPVQS